MDSPRSTRRGRWVQAAEKKMAELKHKYADYRRFAEQGSKRSGAANLVSERDRLQISLDSRRTFSVFRKLAEYLKVDIGQNQESLARILEAYCACARKEMTEGRPWCGYVQGMSYVAAVPLLVLREEEDAFALTVSVLDDVLGPCGVYARWPTFVGCQALAAALCSEEVEGGRLLIESVGVDSVADILANVCVKWLAGCFYSALPPVSMLALWDTMVDALLASHPKPYWPLLSTGEMILNSVSGPLVERLRIDGLLGETDECAGICGSVLARPTQEASCEFVEIPPPSAGLVRRYEDDRDKQVAAQTAPRVCELGGLEDADIELIRSQFDQLRVKYQAGQVTDSIASFEVLEVSEGVCIRDFQSMVQSVRPGYPEEKVENLFRLLDTTSAGELHFFEAVVGVALVAAPGAQPLERMQLLFTLFGTEKPGVGLWLRRDDLFWLCVALLKAADQDCNEPPPGVHQSLMSLGRHSYLERQTSPPRDMVFSNTSARSSAWNISLRLGVVARAGLSPGLELKANRLVRRLLMGSADAGDEEEGLTLEEWVQGGLANMEVCNALAAVGLTEDEERAAVASVGPKALKFQRKGFSFFRLCTIL